MDLSHLTPEQAIREAIEQAGGVLPAAVAARMVGVNVKTLREWALHDQGRSGRPRLRPYWLPGETRLMVGALDVWRMVRYFQAGGDARPNDVVSRLTQPDPQVAPDGARAMSATATAGPAQGQAIKLGERVTGVDVLTGVRIRGYLIAETGTSSLIHEPRTGGPSAVHTATIQRESGRTDGEPDPAWLHRPDGWFTWNVPPVGPPTRVAMPDPDEWAPVDGDDVWWCNTCDPEISEAGELSSPFVWERGIIRDPQRDSGIAYVQEEGATWTDTMAIVPFVCVRPILAQSMPNGA